MNHLQYFTLIKVHNANIIFIIKVPITSPNPLDTYHLHYIPYKNVTLIKKSPYLLTESEHA